MTRAKSAPVKAGAIIEADKGTALVAPPPPPNSVEGVAQMLALAVDRGHSPEALEKLLDLHERVRAQAAKQAFDDAMARVQRSVPRVTKHGWNPHTKSRFAKHEDVLAALVPVMTEEGFSMTYGTKVSQPGWLTITADVAHAAGHREHYELPLPLDGEGAKGAANKTGVQATGSTIAYGRRYLACMIWNIATGDDVDGNGSGDEAERVTEQQLLDLNTLITDAKADKEKLLDFAKVSKLEDISPAKYKEVVRMLNVKLKGVS